MTVGYTEVEHPVRDVEKVFGLMAALHGKLDDIVVALDDDTFAIDMYGDDPNGVSGIITTQFGAGGPIYRNYNGPYVIEAILATWVITGSPTATLQLGARILQLGASGFFNPQALHIQMDRDDPIIFKLSAAQPCHLEINGHVDRRVIESIKRGGR